LKPPEPLATQIEEPKMNVILSSSSMVLVMLKDVIEFFNDSIHRMDSYCLNFVEDSSVPLLADSPGNEHDC
jgi:hypothetical protein